MRSILLPEGEVELQELLTLPALHKAIDALRVLNGIDALGTSQRTALLVADFVNEVIACQIGNGEGDGGSVGIGFHNAHQVGTADLADGLIGRLQHQVDLIGGLCAEAVTVALARGVVLIELGLIALGHHLQVEAARQGVGHHSAEGQLHTAVGTYLHSCMAIGRTSLAIYSHIVDVGIGHGLTHDVMQREVDVAVFLVDDITYHGVAVIYLVYHVAPALQETAITACAGEDGGGEEGPCVVVDGGVVIVQRVIDDLILIVQQEEAHDVIGLVEPLGLLLLVMDGLGLSALRGIDEVNELGQHELLRLVVLHVGLCHAVVHV